MSSCKISKRKKMHDDYLLCSKNFLTSEHNETPKTQRKRKTSNFSNPSNKKTTVRSLKKNKHDFDFQKVFSKPMQYGKMKEKMNLSNDKTKRLDLTKSKRDSHFESISRIEGTDRREKRKNNRVSSQDGKSLEALYDRCSQVLTSFQKRYDEMKK